MATRYPRTGLLAPALLLSFAFVPAICAVPARAEDECRSKPGKTAPDGEHWYYSLDDGKKCWYTAPVGTRLSKSQRHAAAAKETPAKESAKAGAAPAARTAVKDATVASAAREEDAVPAASKLAAAGPVAVKTTRVRNTGDAYAEMTNEPPPARRAAPAATAGIGPVPQVAMIEPVNRQLAALSSVKFASAAVPQVDVDAMLAASPDMNDPGPAKSMPSVPSAVSADEGPGSGLSWLGALLIALGALAMTVRPILNGFGAWFEAWREERRQDESEETDVTWRFAFGRENADVMPFRGSSPLRGLRS